MERGNTKHGPQRDDHMAKQIRAQTQGSPAGTRTREWYEAEPAGEDEAPGVLLPHGAVPGAEASPTPEEIAARSELGRWIARSVLPTDREGLLRAVDDTTPAYVTDQLRALPAGRVFGTVFEVWEALGHANESRH